MARKTNIFLAIGIVLVALIAGCSNEFVYPHFPVSAYIEQTGDFLEGQSFTSSNFKVTVSYLDGSDKEYPNAGVVLDDPDGIVNAGDTVSIDVGTDAKGEPVIGKATLSVYKLGKITADTKETVYAYTGNQAAPVELSADDVIVTAHYEGDKTLVLKPSDYQVTGIKLVKAYDPYAETFEAEATVTTNLISTETEGSDCKLTITLTQTPITGNVLSVEEIVGYAEVEGVKTSFQIPALNYESKDDLPAIDASKVYIKVTTDATAEGEYAYVLASAVEDLELSYVDPTTKIALDDKWNTYDFANISANSETGVAIVAAWNETTTEPLTVQAAETSLKVEYSGDGIVDGTENKDLSVDDFRVYLIVNGQSELVEGLNAADFIFAKYSTGSNESSTAISDEYAYVTVNYMGVAISKTTGAKVTVLDAIPAYTITEAKFVKDDATGVVYQQKYNAGQMPTAAVKADLAEVTIFDGTDYATLSSTANAEEWANVTVGGYFVDDKDGKKVPLTAGYDFTSADAKVYVAVTYTPEKGEAATYYAEFAKSTAVVESITLSVAYKTMYGNTAQPMLDSAIEYTVTGITPNGTVDLTVIDSSNINYYVDGADTNVPAALDADSLGAEIGAVYAANLYSNTVVLEDQPHGYFKAADSVTTKFVLNADDQFFIGSKITLEESDYDIAEGAYEYVKGYEGETVPTAAAEVPHITAVSGNPFVPVAETGNKVNIQVAYLDSTGKVAEQTAVEFSFNGKVWAEEDYENSLDITISGTSLKESRGDESKQVQITSGSYLLGTQILISGLTTHGYNAYSVDVEQLEGSVTWADGSMTIGGYSRARIEISWNDNNGTPMSASFYVITQ